jgi:hypothetical protein
MRVPVHILVHTAKKKKKKKKKEKKKKKKKRKKKGVVSYCVFVYKMAMNLMLLHLKFI